MHAGAVTATIVGALLLAAWSLVAVVRERFVDWSHLIGAAALELAILVQAVVAIVDIAGGARPGSMVTFIGYLITAVLFLPLAVTLALMERTRWGSVIVTGGAVTVAVLMLRLLQVWQHG